MRICHCGKLLHVTRGCLSCADEGCSCRGRGVLPDEVDGIEWEEGQVVHWADGSTSEIEEVDAEPVEPPEAERAQSEREPKAHIVLDDVGALRAAVACGAVEALMHESGRSDLAGKFRETKLELARQMGDLGMIPPEGMGVRDI